MFLLRRPRSPGIVDSVARSLPSRRSPWRRSSTRMSSAHSAPISSQRLSAKSTSNRSSTRVAAFSSARLCAPLESARVRRRVRRSRRRCLRRRTTPAALFDPPRQCRQLEHLVLRRPGTHVCSAHLQPHESKRSPRTARTVWRYAHHARFQITPLSWRHSLDGTSIRAKPTIFRRLSTETAGANSSLDFVPGLAIDGIDQAGCPLARKRCRVRQAALRVGPGRRPRPPSMRRAFSASAAAPFRSYRPTARSAAARAPRRRRQHPNRCQCQTCVAVID